MRGGISFPPWPRFRRPPYNPGRPDFPWSGLKPWLSSVSLPIVGEVQALVRIRPSSVVYPRPRVQASIGVTPVLSSRPPHIADKDTAKCPESLRPLPVLPP